MIHDVAVVGGGPVGLAAAIEARMAGLTVALVEQRSGVIDKACGEGLMPGAVVALDRLGVHPDGHPLRGVTYRQGERSVTHRFEGKGGFGVRRTVLHAALSARANELGVTRVTAKVDRIDSLENALSVSAYVSANWLIGCDGLHSTIARLTGLALPGSGNGRGGSGRSESGRRYGVRQHYSVAPWTDNIEVHFGRGAELYVTPVDSYTVGIAMLAPRGMGFDDALAAVPELAERVAGAEAASSRRGAGPFSQRTRRRTAGRVLLAGDASGYVDALTGEGMRVGFAQARAAIHCIVAGQPQRYEREWSRATRDFRVLTTALVSWANSPLRGGIVPIATRAPWLFGHIVERLAR